MMKHNSAGIFLFVLMGCFYQHGQAQSKDAEIRGSVFNEEKLPALFSTVILMNKDSVFMQGTLSQDDGSFVLENLNTGEYFVMVRNIEFENYVSAPIILQPNETHIMDTILLKTRLTGIDEAVIKGQKAMVEVHPDKMVFNVSSSVNSTGDNGLELLSKAPGVIVDLDKNIILQGKSGVRIFINGRPSRLSGSDLSNMLEGMRSDNIESIEIITNPSAKYEAEGTGGILNIVLKKNINSGFNGNLITSYSKGDYERKSIGANLNYRRNKINFYSSLNVSDDLYQDNFVQTTERTDFLLDMESDSENNRNGYNLSGGIDYTLTDQQTLSLDARALINERDNLRWSNTLISDQNEISPSEMLYSRVVDDMLSRNFNTNLHYSFIPDRFSDLSADISFGTYASENNTWQPNEYYDESENTLLETVESQYDSETKIDLVSGKIDYERKLTFITLSMGAKYSYINTDNSLAFYNFENSQPVLDLTRSNTFTYLEKIASAYFIFNIKPSEKLNVNAGIRVENTSSLGELESQITVNNNVVPRNYTSLFPNVSVSFDDQKNNVISLSVGRRISRPNYQDLNPFESKLSEISAWKGNPFLKPNYIYNYQVTYSFKRKLVVSNTYSITRDFFANIFITVDDKSSIITPRNMQKVINNGLSVSYPLQVLKWWQFSSFFIYNYESYYGDIEETKIDLEAHVFSFRMQNNLNMPWDMRMEVTYFYRSPWIWRGTINVDDFHMLNVGLKKSFFNDKFQVQLTANDILNTSSDYYYNSNYGGMIIDGVRSFDNRRFGGSLTYKFGNQKLKTGKRKNSAIDEELNRIAE